MPYRQFSSLIRSARAFGAAETGKGLQDPLYVDIFCCLMFELEISSVCLGFMVTYGKGKSSSKHLGTAAHTLNIKRIRIHFLRADL